MSVIHSLFWISEPFICTGKNKVNNNVNNSTENNEINLTKLIDG